MPTGSPSTCKNPLRVAAGRRNWQKRGPWTDEARNRVRQAILERQPWLKSTGPRTPEGKARVAKNGKLTQKGPRSVREVRVLVADINALIDEMQQSRAIT